MLQDRMSRDKNKRYNNSFHNSSSGDQCCTAYIKMIGLDRGVIPIRTLSSSKERKE